jgi:hypothetical protein
MTRWEALREILNSKEHRRAIGSAWPLYFYLIFETDKSNRLITSYFELKEKLGESTATIKKWKERLIREKVVEGKAGRHNMVIKVLPPYDTPLSCWKTDITEIEIKSDPETKKLLTRLFSSNNTSLLPLIAELAHRIEVLEKQTK